MDLSFSSSARRLRRCVGFILGSATLALAAYEGPVPAPTDTYGAPGPHAVVVEQFPSPDWADQVITVLRPTGEPTRRPTWFFAHGFAGHNVTYYRELLHHLASHGYVVVFSPYPAQPLQVERNYQTVFAGFAAAARRYADWIDVSRVGFAGHSYGGGAVPALALRAVREEGWGTQGLALLMLAPWYSFGVSDADLATFPRHTQAVVQIYEDDLINDHRMAVDVFIHLALPDANKDFLLVRSDRIEGYNYVAGHHVPTGAEVPRPGAASDALDVWGVHRLAAALGASALQGDVDARAIALGDGGPAQTGLGATPSGRRLRPMLQSDAPVALYPQSRYAQAFHAPLNPRRGSRLPAPPRGPELVNLSARAWSGTPGHPLILGAVVAGPRPKSLLLRAVGPALRPHGVAQPLEDPALTVFRGDREDLTLDNWAEAIEPETLLRATDEVGAFPFPADSRDAAILASFDPGSLTLHIGNAAGGAGVALLELYAADDRGGTQVRNLSARAWVGTGEATLIGGFVIRGPGSLRLLLRAVGPGLVPHGVTATVPDPALDVRRADGVRLSRNDNWSEDAAQAAAIATAAQQVGAFPVPSGSTDAALVIDLPPGAYTAQVHSRDQIPGTALLEIYVVPQ